MVYFQYVPCLYVSPGLAEAGAVSLAPGRAKCNSVLHLFGAWLFEAALVGTNIHSSAKHTQGETVK